MQIEMQFTGLSAIFIIEYTSVQFIGLRVGLMHALHCTYRPIYVEISILDDCMHEIVYIFLYSILVHITLWFWRVIDGPCAVM